MIMQKRRDEDNPLLRFFVRHCFTSSLSSFSIVDHFFRMAHLSFHSTMSLVLFFSVTLSPLSLAQQGNYNFFMPDLPSNSRVSPPPALMPTVTMTRETHSFPMQLLTKIHLQGGPFNVKLYRNSNLNDTSMSVDVETEPSIQKMIQIETDQTDRLTIRLIATPDLQNRTNISLLITYSQLNELSIDGHIYLQCLNQIQSDTFRVHNRGEGSMKLKLNVNILDAYLHSIGRVKFCGQVNDEGTLQSLGVGDVDARKLLAKKINVISSGIGNIYVTATDEINITLSGIGTVYYTGPLKHEMKTGLGNIMEMQDISFVNSQ